MSALPQNYANGWMNWTRRAAALLLIITTLTSQAIGDPATTLKKCDTALQLSTQEIELLKVAIATEQQYGQILKKQRDEAINQITVPSAVPFYVWVVLGVAGGVVLTRGIR